MQTKARDVGNRGIGEAHYITRFVVPPMESRVDVVDTSVCVVGILRFWHYIPHYITTDMSPSFGGFLWNVPFSVCNKKYGDISLSSDGVAEGCDIAAWIYVSSSGVCVLFICFLGLSDPPNTPTQFACVHQHTKISSCYVTLQKKERVCLPTEMQVTTASRMNILIDGENYDEMDEIVGAAIQMKDQTFVFTVDLRELTIQELAQAWPCVQSTVAKYGSQIPALGNELRIYAIMTPAVQDKNTLREKVAKYIAQQGVSCLVTVITDW